MAVLEVVQQASGLYSLQGDLDRNSVVKAWPDRAKQLKADAAQTIVLDLGGVSHVDTAGLAWLVNMMVAAKQANHDILFKNTPTSLLKLAKISDVEQLLPLQ